MVFQCLSYMSYQLQQDYLQMGAFNPAICSADSEGPPFSYRALGVPLGNAMILCVYLYINIYKRLKRAGLVSKRR